MNAIAVKASTSTRATIPANAPTRYSLLNTIASYVLRQQDEWRGVPATEREEHCNAPMPYRIATTRR